MIEAAALSALIAACAPQVHPQTMAEVIRVESDGDEFAINVNRSRRQPPRQVTLAGAVAVTRWHIARGYSVDLGLVQLNSRNLPALGLSVEAAFEPCANIAAGARILSDAYRKASVGSQDEQQALLVALSAYNTGSPVRGFLNGYVARYYPSVGAPVVASPPAVSVPDPGIIDDAGYAGTVAVLLAEDSVEGLSSLLAR